MQKTEPIIEVKNVSMRFNLAKEKTDTFKEQRIGDLRSYITSKHEEA